MDFVRKPAFVIGIAALVALGIGAYAVVASRGASGAAGEDLVSRRNLTEEVAGTGTVTAAETVDLAAEASGKVVRVTAKAGGHVAKGQVLVSLDAGSLSAQLEQAESALEREELKLRDLESIAGNGTSGSQAGTAIANSLQGVKDKTLAAYATNVNTLAANVDVLFGGGDKEFRVDIKVGNSAYRIEAPASLGLPEKRQEVARLMDAWAAANAAASTEEGILAANAAGREALAATQRLLEGMNAALSNYTTETTDTTAEGVYASYRTGVSQALTATNASLAGLVAAEQQYRTAQSAASPHEIGLQRTVVKSAAAQVDSIRAQLAKTSIVSPIDGTVTAQNAHVGESASPGQPLVSIISDGAFQVEVFVSEADVRNVKAGQRASATLDAYGESAAFPANVVAVDPAATPVDGVMSYKVTLQFDGNDGRIKAGMTANVRITTVERADALAIPERAIITRGTESFVLVDSGGQSPEERKVDVGVRGGGYVEILSGLVEGERIISFGASAN